MLGEQDMGSRKNFVAGAAIAAMTLAAASAHAAGNLITNGDFESGDYTGWNANVEDG
jgi:hypothetical protein